MSMAACSLAGGPAVEPRRVATRIRRASVGRGHRIAEQRRAAPHATSSGSPSAATIGSASRRSASSTWANSSTPDGHRKHLKPSTPARASGASVGAIARHDAAPESDVDVAPAARRGALRLQASDGCRRRNAVERHVDDRRHAAGGRGARRVLEAFPLGSARLVDVHVGVDEAGQHDVCAGVQLRHACRAVDVSRRQPTMRPSRTSIVAGRTPSGRTTRSLRMARSTISFQLPASELPSGTADCDCRL